MLSVLVNMAVGGGILCLILAFWLGVQHLVRKTDKLPPDCDVLAAHEHGCGQCSLHGKCAIEQEEQDKGTP